MEKLKSLDLSRLRHAEAGQLVVRFFEDFANAGLDASKDADFKTMFNTLKAQLPTYNEALNQIRASEESKKIEEADHLRDTDLQALKDALKPYRNIRNAREHDAYAALHLLLSENRDIATLNYEEETNRLNALLQRLQAAPYLAHTETLGITKFVTQLAESAKTFSDLFARRSYQNSQKISYDVKALRKQLMKDYTRMASYIATLAGVKQDAFYRDTFAVINNGRTYFSETILARRSAAPKDSETK